MTRTIAGTVPDGKAHLIFAVYVCVDTVLVTYNTAHNIVQPKQSVCEASRTQPTQGNEGSRQVRVRRYLHSLPRLPLVTVGYTSVTFVIFVRGSGE